MPTYPIHTAKNQDYQGSVPSQRQDGYILRITPPMVTIQHGEDDIEGIGGWPYHPPRRHALRFVGWYRYKADALQRLEERTKAEVLHEHERNTINELAHALRLAQRGMQPPDPDHAEQDARYTKNVETIARPRANAKGKQAARRSFKPHRLNR